ncbi:unnamed protein product [Closterium sp. NIES-53]
MEIARTYMVMPVPPILCVCLQSATPHTSLTYGPVSHGFSPPPPLFLTPTPPLAPLPSRPPLRPTPSGVSHHTPLPSVGHVGESAESGGPVRGGAPPVSAPSPPSHPPTPPSPVLDALVAVDSGGTAAMDVASGGAGSRGANAWSIGFGGADEGGIGTGGAAGAGCTASQQPQPPQQQQQQPLP